MPDFTDRSNKKELLDQPEIPKVDLFRNLDELHTINKCLGGYAISKDALRKVKKKGLVVDIGCGGGDTLVELKKFSDHNRLGFEFAGLDLNPTCVQRSIERCSALDIAITKTDYRNLFEVYPDTEVVHCSLFTHHLSNEDIIELIRMCLDNKATFVVNDLERNPIAHYSIKMLTSLFSRSYLVKNDAPLSVLRGFKKSEWIELVESAGAKSFSVKWKWAFRHQIIVHG